MSENGTAPLFEITGGRAEEQPGPNEQAARTMIAARVAAGLLDDELFAAEIAAVITEARDVDQSQGIGRPSGRAQLYATYHDALATIPRPEIVAAASDLERALEVIQGGTAA